MKPTARTRSIGLVAALIAGLALAGVWFFSRDVGDPSGEPPTGDMVFIETDGGGFYIDPYEFPNKAGTKPQTLETIQVAREACASVGKRLCTDGEWRRACLGPEGRNIFGYQGPLDSALCNSARELNSGHSGMVDPDSYREGVTPSGGMAECRSEEGVFDMVGNMEEWVLSSWQGLGGNLEGGAWFTVLEYASCTGAYSRQPHYIIELERPLFTAGTRCCWSEDAPTEERLSPEALAADTKQRLEEARSRSSALPYDPTDEVLVSPGLWIDRYEYPNRKGEHPLVAVSWTEARERCEAADKRLCTVAEWELACGGAEGSRYPYGDSLRRDACALLEDQSLPAGSKEACRAPSGAMDMVGGAWEWTSNRFSQPSRVYREGTALREVRGGSWLSVHGDGTCRPEYGFPAASEHAAFPDVGFRCCHGAAAAVTHTPEATQAIECPPTMASVGAFCIDRYEVPNEAGKTPRGDLSLEDAVSLCRARGVHLCSEDEWLLACEGRDRRRWPYGDEYDATICQHGREVRDGPTPIKDSGVMKACKTPEGVYDLSGNLWEWTKSKDGEGILRGGGPSFNALFGQCGAIAVPKTGYSAFDTGARCCASRDELESTR